MSEGEIVYVVDDDAASREAVVSLVTEMGVEAQSFASAEDFLAAYEGRRPACLVTDVRLLRMSGLELQDELLSRGYSLATIVLTAYADTPITVRAMKGGAVTLLEKPCRDLELWDAIRAGLAEDQERFERDSRRREVSQRMADLTPAEQDVLELIVVGEPNKVIADQLDISLRTVEVRRQNIFSKLHANSLAELVRMVLEAKQE